MTDGSEWVNKFFPDVKKIKIKDRFEKPKYGIPYSRKPVSSLPSKIIKTLFPDLSIYKNMDAYICGGATILSDCPWYSIRTIQWPKEAMCQFIYGELVWLRSKIKKH